MYPNFNHHLARNQDAIAQCLRNLESHIQGRMQRQGNKSPRNKPGLRLNLVLLKLVFKWYAETWFKLGLTKPSLNKLGLIKTGLN